jgi:hypothetical protein
MRRDDLDDAHAHGRRLDDQVDVLVSPLDDVDARRRAAGGRRARHLRRVAGVDLGVAHERRLGRP